MTDDVEPTTETPAETPIGREAPPTMPSRQAFVASFLSVVVAGVFGGVIGYGLVDISSSHSSMARIVGTVVGATIAAVGVGIVAVLVLRAMAEWRRNPTPPPRTRARS